MNELKILSQLLLSLKFSKHWVKLSYTFSKCSIGLIWFEQLIMKAYSYKSLAKILHNLINAELFAHLIVANIILHTMLILLTQS